MIKKIFSVMMLGAMIAITSCTNDEDILTNNIQATEEAEVLTRAGQYGYQELDADLEGVTYTITKDVTKAKGQVMANILAGGKKDPLVEQCVNEAKKADEERENSLTRCAAPEIPSGFRTIDYTYESIDERGQRITLSSRVVWGVYIGANEINPCYIMLAPHFTIADNFSCPTQGACLDNLMFKGDKLLILPDYLGFGVTKDHVQPYINHELCARNCIDALKAGFKIFRDHAKCHMANGWKLYVAGVSQGGGNALAIHKWLDTHADFAKRWNFHYSYCGSGPYKPTLTFEKYFEQKVLTYPVVMPLTLKAMMAAYPEILGKWKEEDFYSKTFLQHKAVIDQMVNSKEYATNEINEYIFSIFPHEGDKNVKGGEEVLLSDILSKEALDRNSELCKKLFECLDKNDLTKGWTPTHPIHLYHGKSDLIVSYANAEAVVEAFPSMATLKTIPWGCDGHIGSCLAFMKNIVFGTW